PPKIRLRILCFGPRRSCVGRWEICGNRGPIFMNCDWVGKNIQLYIYNELADDARYELEQHVARCGECAKELKSARGLYSMLSRLPVQEPSPNLLAASRMKLQE